MNKLKITMALVLGFLGIGTAHATAKTSAEDMLKAHAVNVQQKTFIEARGAAQDYKTV